MNNSLESQRNLQSKRTAAHWPIAVASAAVAAAIVAATFGVLALRSHPPSSPAAVTTPRDTLTATASPDPAPSKTSRPSAQGVSPSPTQSATAGATPATTASAGPDNIWVAQLDSVSVAAGTARLDETLARIRLEIPAAQVLTSSDYASLGHGFWVIYYAGSFTNGAQALAFCAAHGRPTRHLCLGRYLSHNATDTYYQCYPPATTSSPRCVRP
jgi:eukaryotic-like serine/threonine-protein kinase